MLLSGEKFLPLQAFHILCAYIPIQVQHYKFFPHLLLQQVLTLHELMDVEGQYSMSYPLFQSQQKLRPQTLMAYYLDPLFVTLTTFFFYNDTVLRHTFDVNFSWPRFYFSTNQFKGFQKRIPLIIIR